jgi:hypothetical protein
VLFNGFRLSFDQLLHALQIFLEFSDRLRSDERLKQPGKKTEIFCSHFEAQERFPVLFRKRVIASVRETVVGIAERSNIDRKRAIFFAVRHGHFHIDALVFIDFAQVKLSAYFAASGWNRNVLDFHQTADPFWDEIIVRKPAEDSGSGSVNLHLRYDVIVVGAKT